MAAAAAESIVGGNEFLLWPPAPARLGDQKGGGVLNVMRHSGGLLTTLRTYVSLDVVVVVIVVVSRRDGSSPFILKKIVFPVSFGKPRGLSFFKLI